MKHSVKVLAVAGVLAATAAIPALLTATTAIPTVPAAAAGTGWWPSNGYLATNSSFNPNETSVTVSTIANLKLKYHSDPARSGLHAPVIADGLVYTPDSGGVTAFDEATGVPKWRFELEAGKFYPPSRLVHTDGRIVLAARPNFNHPGYDLTQIFVLDAATGAVLRQFDDEGVVAQILVDKGVVVVSGESRYSADTRAYRLADGQFLWQFDRYMDRPTSANGRIVLSGTGTSARPLTSSIVDIVTGNVIYTVAGRYYRPLATDETGTKFFIGWGRSLQVLDAATGELTWLASNLYPNWAVVSPSRLYITSTNGTVSAVNRSTGAVIWSRPFPQSHHQRAIIAGGVLYVTAKGNRVHALNPVDGASLNAPAFAGAVDQVVVTHGRVYATDGTKLTVYGL